MPHQCPWPWQIALWRRTSAQIDHSIRGISTLLVVLFIFWKEFNPENWGRCAYFLNWGWLKPPTSQPLECTKSEDWGRRLSVLLVPWIPWIWTDRMDRPDCHRMGGKEFSDRWMMDDGLLYYDHSIVGDD